MYKVLQLGKFFPLKGGVEKVEYTLMSGLSERGIPCDMLCAATDGKGMTVAVNAKAKLMTCRTWKKMAATMLAPSMITQLRRICREYDIIHVHHPDPMACLALLLSGYKGKVVLHWHSDIVKQKTLLKFYMPLQNWLIRRADVIVGTSPVYTEESPHLSKAQDKVVTVPIGVDAVEPDARKVEQLKQQYPGKRIIFALGRLVEYKGFAYLIEAARHLSDDYVVLIGGLGPLKAQLQEQIQQQKLEDKVKLLGYVDDNLLPQLFGACDLFCLPSVFKTEAFGLVQIEAMSCGKPVVATRIQGSGVAWVNGHDESGLNVEVGNGRKLAEAIGSIVEDGEVYAGFAARAQERYRRLFTTERMIDRMIEVYEQCLLGKTKKRINKKECID